MKKNKPYLCSQSELVSGGWALLGAPLDETGSYKKGASGGPDAIRRASDCLEEYCPVCDNSLEDIAFADLGNVKMPYKELEKAQNNIGQAVTSILDKNARPLLLGGEHTVSVAAIKELAKRNEELCVIQLDAHADLRQTYDNTPLSHACAMRRALDVIDPANLFQVGIRSGTREEWQWMRSHYTVYPPTIEAIKVICDKVGNKPVYLTIDLDVLDPSVMPGTGTPEPGGISYQELEQMLFTIKTLNIVAADVVELAPLLDFNAISEVVAAKVVRSLLLMFD